MKAQYLIPTTEVIKVELDAQILAISGPEGLKDGGSDPGVVPRAPGRPIFLVQ